MLKRDRKEGQKKLFIAKKSKRKMAAVEHYEWKSDSREIEQCPENPRVLCEHTTSKRRERGTAST